MAPWLFGALVVLTIFSPALFTHRGFGIDCSNHLYLVGYSGRAWATQGHPSLFLHDGTKFVFEPFFAFYGGMLYGAAAISWIDYGLGRLTADALDVAAAAERDLAGLYPGSPAGGAVRLRGDEALLRNRDRRVPGRGRCVPATPGLRPPFAVLSRRRPNRGYTRPLGCPSDRSAKARRNGGSSAARRQSADAER